MSREIVFNEVEVVSKVVGLFWQKGYNGTSVQDLTTVTGLNRSSIYNSFGSKKELYKLALKTYQKTTLGLLQKVLLKSKNSSEALQSIFDNLIISIVKDIDSKGCFIINCTSEMSQKDKSINTWLQENQETTINFFEQLITEGQQEGFFNKNNPATIYAHYLVSAIQGIKLTGILIKDESVLKKITKSSLSVLFN